MSAAPLDPDRVAAAEFSTAFRGYDSGEVRALLHTVGTALREAAEREHELRDQLARAERDLRDLRESMATQIEGAAEEARREGREMVAEAQRVRERMLGDLARRRRNARQQVEQLMAGRERLLEAFDAARQTIDAATQDMRGALPEARLAAEAAGRRFDQEVAGEDDEVAVAALEDEIEAARLVGLPLVAASRGAEPITSQRADPAVLGERNVPEMPLVELGADFEDVRIVPLETSAGGTGVEGLDAAEELDTGSGARDLESGPDVGEEVEDERTVAEGAAEPVSAGTEPEDVTPPEAVPGGASGEHDAVPAAVTEPPAATGPTADVPPLAPRHLDDLFASLRAARAEAVSDARSVLERDADAPLVDTSDPAPDDGTLEAEAEAEAVEEQVESPATSDENAPAEPEPEPAEDAAHQLSPQGEGEVAGPVADGVEEVASRPAPVPAVALVPAPADVEATISAAGERLASALKRVLADEQNELLDRLRKVGRGRRADEPGVLGDPAGMVARFAATAEAPLTEAAGVAMASTAPEKRARPPAVGPLATAAATELVEPLHERLERCLGEAGTDTAEASARARATFREWKTRRIGVAAADAARGAFHAGLLAGVGRAARLRWSLDDVDTACPECADNALAGPVTRGERYPTGHRHPPAHDGCRCTLAVVEEGTQ